MRSTITRVEDGVELAVTDGAFGFAVELDVVSTFFSTLVLEDTPFKMVSS